MQTALFKIWTQVTVFPMVITIAPQSTQKFIVYLYACVFVDVHNVWNFIRQENFLSLINVHNRQ